MSGVTKLERPPLNIIKYLKIRNYWFDYVKAESFKLVYYISFDAKFLMYFNIADRE